MFILLTEQNKKKLFREYRIRLLSVFLIFVSIFFLVSTCLLLSSYIKLSSENTLLQIKKDTFSAQIMDKNNKGLQSSLSDIKSMASLAVPQNTKIIQAVSAILAKRPADISITSFGYTRGEGALSSFVIQGTAGLRSDLISFSKDLQKEPLFSSVTLPVSNLAKESGVKFVLTILGKF